MTEQGPERPCLPPSCTGEGTPLSLSFPFCEMGVITVCPINSSAQHSAWHTVDPQKMFAE